ncbi:hypothetical protein H4I95_00806 [Botrytis cinerea]
MLFLKPVDLPNPVYRDIVARPGHTYEKPCILVLYAAIPPTPTVDSILLFFLSFLLYPCILSYRVHSICPITTITTMYSSSLRFVLRPQLLRASYLNWRQFSTNGTHG